MSNSPLLEIKNLNISYVSSNGNERVIVNDGNLSINPGEIVLIIGENGSGKSSIFKSIVGDLNDEVVEALNKAIGTKAALVPLTISAIPFVARVIESALRSVDHGLIEAARSFGASNTQIIFRVYLKEAFPAILSGITAADHIADTMCM